MAGGCVWHVKGDKPVAVRPEEATRSEDPRLTGPYLFWTVEWINKLWDIYSMGNIFWLSTGKPRQSIFFEMACWHMRVNIQSPFTAFSETTCYRQTWWVNSFHWFGGQGGGLRCAGWMGWPWRTRVRSVEFVLQMTRSSYTCIEVPSHSWIDWQATNLLVGSNKNSSTAVVRLIVHK